MAAEHDREQALHVLSDEAHRIGLALVECHREHLGNRPDDVESYIKGLQEALLTYQKAVGQRPARPKPTLLAKALQQTSKRLRAIHESNPEWKSELPDWYAGSQRALELAEQALKADGKPQQWLCRFRGLVEPEVVSGPFPDDIPDEAIIDALADTDKEDDLLFLLEITSGQPSLGSFSGGTMDALRAQVPP